MFPDNNTLKFVFTVLTIVLLMFGTGVEAGLTLPDVGMVTMLDGPVTYTDGQGQKKPAQSFMKIRTNDRFILTADSSIQLVFFGDGRKETWKGPLSLMIGDKNAFAEGTRDNKGPEIQAMPESIASEVRRVAALIDSARLQRTGSVTVRGKAGEDQGPIESMSLSSQENQVIEKARARYEEMLKETGAHDITAELYFFSVLADYDQFDQMKELITVMRGKQPDNSQIDLLSEWLNKQIL